MYTDNFNRPFETTKYHGKQDGVTRLYSKEWSSKDNGFAVFIC